MASVMHRRGSQRIRSHEIHMRNVCNNRSITYEVVGICNIYVYKSLQFVLEQLALVIPVKEKAWCDYIHYVIYLFRYIYIVGKYLWRTSHSIHKTQYYLCGHHFIGFYYHKQQLNARPIRS